MGKNKKSTNNGNNEDKGGDKSSSVVLKVDFHCDGCREKIMKCVRRIDGVETTKAEPEKSKLTVTVVGDVDPVKLRDELGKKTKKKVELLSPLPSEKDKQKQKDGGEKKPEDKELPVKTLVLKVAWHCEGCARNLHKVLSSHKEIYKVSIDKEKDQVTVRGAVDPKALVDSLKHKLKRQVEIIADKKTEKDKDKDKDKEKDKDKDKKAAGASCGKDNKEAQSADKFEYFLVGNGYGCRDVKSGEVIGIFYAPQCFGEDNAHSCSVM